MPQDVQDIQDFLIDYGYKRLDRMKTQIRRRFQELEGGGPSPEELQYQCWNIWRLTTCYAKIWHQERGHDDDAGHAPYMPPEVAGERADRMLAMDARLEAVLGDAVDVEDDEDDEDDEAFQPSPADLVTLVEYGRIIAKHRAFVDAFNTLHLWPGDDGCVMNIIQRHHDGFDQVMRLVWDRLQARLRGAPEETEGPHGQGHAHRD